MEKQQEYIQLSSEIMRFARSTLFIHLRMMENAFLNIHPDTDLNTASMAVDGYTLAYSPKYICNLFMKEQTCVTRNYLHCVLHCLYRHFFVGQSIRRDVWDLACDIQVEYIISRLQITSLYANRQESQNWLIRELEKELPSLTAERIYRYFMDQHLSYADCEHLRENFYVDDHAIWYDTSDSSNASKTGVKSDVDEEGNNDEVQADGQGEDSDTENDEGSQTEQSSLTVITEQSGSGVKAGKDNRDNDGADTPALAPSELEQKWREISERIQLDLETNSVTYGEGTGDILQGLRELNREKYDYADFLKRFSTMGENVHINDDEYDYVYYTFGMQEYGDMPLIEPLEYKEEKRVREFVIALDTSQSVSGDLVQTFVQKTWNLMKQTDNFFSTVNIHIMQCGARVEEDVKITNQNDFDRYMKRMVLKGFGGTDFRPVFERIDQLIHQHEFSNLKGMIYFTDGYGTYPAMPPGYETAFVFIDNGQKLPDVPPWAMRVVLREEEINAL